MYTLKEQYIMKQLIDQKKELERRQELPKVYCTNVAKYVADARSDQYPMVVSFNKNADFMMSQRVLSFN